MAGAPAFNVSELIDTRPLGASGAEAFVVIRDAMQDEERVALARIVMNVINLMDALRESLKTNSKRAHPSGASRKKRLSSTPR